MVPKKFILLVEDNPDNREALPSGKGHSHESCWDISRESISTQVPVDGDGLGGSHTYAVPICVAGETIGAIHLGSGEPGS